MAKAYYTGGPAPDPLANSIVCCATRRQISSADGSFAQLSENLRDLLDARLEDWKAEDQVQSHQQSDEAEGREYDKVAVTRHGTKPTGGGIPASAKAGVNGARRSAGSVSCRSEVTKRAEEHIDLFFDCRKRDLGPDAFDILHLPELNALFPFRKAGAHKRPVFRLIERNDPMRSRKIARGALKRHASASSR